MDPNDNIQRQYFVRTKKVNGSKKTPYPQGQDQHHIHSIKIKRIENINEVNNFTKILKVNIF